jgi:ParB/RepB/Spo0J family partition protein
MEEFKDILLDSIRVQKHNVRIHDIDQGIEDLAENIKANGLLQPIAAYYDSAQSRYVILTGQRRLNAHHYLNDKYPGEGFDKIQCKIIPEPKTDEKKKALSLAENITQLPMTKPDLIKAVTDLYNVYGDYEMVRQEFGISKRMVDKYVRLSRLPETLKTAIQKGEIHPNPTKAENMAIRAVDALQYTKNGPIPEDQVLEMAKAMARPGNDPADLSTEAARGGSVSDIEARATKRSKQPLSIDLDTELSEKLQKVSEQSGDTEKARATQYVVEGVERDYTQIGD